jgi:hypothetical protein
MIMTRIKFQPPLLSNAAQHLAAFFGPDSDCILATRDTPPFNRQAVSPITDVFPSASLRDIAAGSRDVALTLRRHGFPRVSAVPTDLRLSNL